MLNDPKLIDVYRAQDERLKSTREQLHGQAGPEARETLEELGTLQESIAAAVMTTPAASGAVAAEDLSTRFTQLTALVERVAQQSNAQVDKEVSELEERTLQARKRLLWQAALLLPLAVIAVFVLTVGRRAPAAPARPRDQRAGRGQLHQPDRRLRSA